MKRSGKADGNIKLVNNYYYVFYLPAYTPQQFH